MNVYVCIFNYVYMPSLFYFHTIYLGHAFSSLCSSHILSTFFPSYLHVLSFLSLSTSTHSLKNKMKIKTKQNTKTNKTNKKISSKIDKNQKSLLHLPPQKLKHGFCFSNLKFEPNITPVPFVSNELCVSIVTSFQWAKCCFRIGTIYLNNMKLMKLRFPTQTCWISCNYCRLWIELCPHYISIFI